MPAPCRRWTVPRPALRRRVREDQPPPPQATTPSRSCAPRGLFYQRLLHQLHAGDGLQVLVVDLLAVGFRDVELVEDAQRLARIHRAAFGIERAVGGEQYLFQRIELEPGLGR